MSDIAMTEMWRYSHCHSNPKSAHIVWLTSSGMQVIFCCSFPDIFQIWNKSHHSGITREDLIWTQLEKKTQNKTFSTFIILARIRWKNSCSADWMRIYCKDVFGNPHSQVFLPLRVSAVRHWNWVSLFWLWLFKFSLVVFFTTSQLYISYAIYKQIILYFKGCFV